MDPGSCRYKKSGAQHTVFRWRTVWPALSRQTGLFLTSSLRVAAPTHSVEQSAYLYANSSGAQLWGLTAEKSVAFRYNMSMRAVLDHQPGLFSLWNVRHEQAKPAELIQQHLLFDRFGHE